MIYYIFNFLLDKISETEVTIQHKIIESITLNFIFFSHNHVAET
jgi:hypothetical protein